MMPPGSLTAFRASLRPNGWISTAFHVSEAPPLFLCPVAREFASFSIAWSQRRRLGCEHQYHRHRQDGNALQIRQDIAGTRTLHVDAQTTGGDHSTASSFEPGVSSALPDQCHGCGALSQTTEPNRAGYFNPGRKSVREYVKPLLASAGRPHQHRKARQAAEEEKIVEAALQTLDRNKLAELGLGLDSLIGGHDTADEVVNPKHPKDPKDPRYTNNASSKDERARPPLCDRCHDLVNHSSGTPIYHPSIEALQQTIEESPHKYNHVYHVIDAADFPMSLLPRLDRLLDMMPLRSRNRRSQTGRFYQDRKTEISFIITRSDLLAPNKEQVDRLLPYLKETLRDALGRVGSNARMGNVRCVSSKRSWWTKELKEDIWGRGGAGWMVGKVNVGKSALFEAVFPKGRMETNWRQQKEQQQGRQQGQQHHPPQRHKAASHQMEVPLQPRASAEAAARASVALDELEDLDELSLLPPARAETNYPEMPVVSSLGGTTASPIRVPFGGGKGELVDLPGLERSTLDMYVKPEHRASLLMKSRIVPEQHVVRPHHSVLLGGFIRLTPRTPNITFLAYAFTPIKAHLTRTDKALAIQGQTGEVNVENIALPGVENKTELAGSFELRWDVTKARAGPITRRDAANIRVDRLPYRVVATDILIEGCGWVEVVAQVRTKDLFAETRADEPPQTLDLSGPDDLHGRDDSALSLALVKAGAKPDEPNWPVIDVYSPEGGFVSSRRPMNAWLLNKPKKVGRSRPRKSMKGQKKFVKAARRAATAE